MFNSCVNSFLFKSLPALGTVTQIISFSNARISGPAFIAIKGKIIKALSKSTGHREDLISLAHVDGASEFTVTYVIFDDTTKTALKSTIDNTGYITTLRTELNEEAIDSITITTVADSEEVIFDGKTCVYTLSCFYLQ